jgi:hypothetical protein
MCVVIRLNGLISFYVIRRHASLDIGLLTPSLSFVCHSGCAPTAPACRGLQSVYGRIFGPGLNDISVIKLFYDHVISRDLNAFIRVNTAKRIQPSQAATAYRPSARSGTAAVSQGDELKQLEFSEARTRLQVAVGNGQWKQI